MNAQEVDRLLVFCTTLGGYIAWHSAVSGWQRRGRRRRIRFSRRPSRLKRTVGADELLPKEPRLKTLESSLLLRIQTSWCSTSLRTAKPISPDSRCSLISGSCANVSL